MAGTAIASAPPGPRPMPLVGSRGNLMRFLADPVGYLRVLHAEHGPVARLVDDGKAWVAAFGPSYNRQVLSDTGHFYSPSLLPFPAPSGSAAQRLDAGLISMNGAQHRQQRRLMLPAFHRRYVETYRDEMQAITERCLERWRPGQELDIAAEMQRITLLVASKTLFGIDATAEAERYGAMISRFLSMLMSPASVVFPYDLPGAPFRQLLALAEQIEAIYRAMIATKRAGGPQHDVLATLIEARDEDGAAMTDAELIGQAQNLFVAGHETSSNALTWTLFLLAQHPQIANDVLDELQGVLGGAAPSLAQLGQLPLLERVIKESMRLLPPAPLVARVAMQPFAFGPYQLPAQTSVMISHYITHHLPELYPEPERFNPDRWLTIDPSPYEYLPFSAGSRMCIGSTFAMMEIRIVLAMVLQRFRLSVRPNLRIDRRVTLTMSPKGGMPMRVAAQDRRFARVAVRGNIQEMVDLV